MKIKYIMYTVQDSSVAYNNDVYQIQLPYDHDHEGPWLRLLFSKINTDYTIWVK
jgi:hypothetical protein